KEAEERIKALGGTAGSSVTRKTTYLVVGADPGSKLDKARSLNIKIINETEFLQLLNQKA
ncbi:MAG: BRCT domain-containing protein, partial [Dehalococcoidales bacterium]